MKTIHFYKDNMSVPPYTEIYCSHNWAVDMIKLDEDEIHTYALSALDFSWLLSRGYKIYLHENNKSFEIKEGICEGCDKEITRSHNILKLWVGGAFDNFFYN